MTSNASRLKEALAGGQTKEKGPVVADGVLSVTPDPPEASWGQSALDTLSADSSFLEDDGGKQPNQLFGKFTWKIENFSDISNHGNKRELRSNQFSVGEYKWYILVYPQGCDVCNHLSLFLCVADYDKLLPGWSHFAQFTIAVVNKDPKKSKYSDTLHRFCKKEHDWGWKKFMELSKVLDGFTVADTLVIKAQVQVILDRPSRPFRCLDSQYRRELVRVYLTNVESICRRFCEEKRQRLAWLRDESGCFKSWWLGLTPERQQQLTRGKGDPILKGIVKQFFNEKEVTSTLVMDALFCGCRQLEKLGRDKDCLPEGFSQPTVVVNGRNSTFSFAMDALDIAQQLSQEFTPASREDKALAALGVDSLGLRSGCDELSELRRDALERDEKRLAELGRKTVEMFALSHIYTEQLERAYRDYECEQRMRDLIAEEEAEGRLQDQRAAARAAADKEKKAKKRERKRAKKELERSRRDADAAQQAKQIQLAANQQQQQQVLATLLQQQPQQQLPPPSSKARSKQQDSVTANGIGLNSRSNSSSSRQASKGQAAAVANGPSRPGSAAAGPSSRLSNSSSPLLGSAAASIDAFSSSDSDGSSSDSSSDGFTPVRRHHHHQQQHLQQQLSRPGSAHSLGRSVGQHIPSYHQQQPQQPQQHQQQQHMQPPQPQQQSLSLSSSGSIPTGYAAAVAGMRPPPPAEVTAAAVAMAEQQRRLRDLEDQVTALKQQVQSLEAALSQKDVVIAQKEQETADLRSQVMQQHQQIQQLTKQAADMRATAVSSQEAAAARPDGVSSSRGSSRSRGTSVDLSDAAAVSSGSGTPVPWAAVAAGIIGSAAAAAAPRDAAAAAAPLGVADSTAAGHQSPGSSTVAEGGPSTTGRAGSMSYAQTVSGISQQQQQHGSRPPSGGSSRANSSSLQAAAAAVIHARTSGMDTTSSNNSSIGRPTAAAAETESAADANRSSTSNGPIESPTAADAAVAVGAAVGAARAEEGPSDIDVPVSPSSIARAGSAAAAGAAPGPPAASSSNSEDSKAAEASSSGSGRSTFEAAASREIAAEVTAAATTGGASKPISSGRAASAGSNPSSSVSSSAADGLPGLSLKTANAYISNGIAGVLHSSTPLSSDSQSTPTLRSSAAPLDSCSSSSLLAADGSGSSSSSKSKAGSLQSSGRNPFTAFGSQLPAGGGRGMPFGPMPTSKQGAVDAGQRASQTSILEDNGLDGFVHMNMIDDLLTE